MSSLPALTTSRGVYHTWGCKREMSQTESVAKHLAELLAEGVTVVPNAYPKDFIDGLRADVKAFIQTNAEIFDKHRDADGHYPRIINLHLAFPELLSVFTDNPVALGVQDGFFNASSSIYTTLYYERGSAQPIHRDTPYFCTRPEYRYLGVWVALEDANEVNGCLQVIRKGHLLPELDRERLALEEYESLDRVPSDSQVMWDKYQDRVSKQCAEAGLKVEKVAVKAGDTVIWHPQLPHGGSAIGDISRTRHSLVMHVAPLGTPVYHQDVFFNPGKPMPEKSAWKYLDCKDRKYAKHASVEFGHADPQPPSAFKRPTQKSMWGKTLSRLFSA